MERRAYCPKHKDVEIALLEVLVELGGQGRPRDVHPQVIKKLAQTKGQDRAAQLPSDDNNWANRIRRAKQRLVERGEMSSPARGIWATTDKGRQRVASRTDEEPSAPSFIELYEEYEAAFRSQLLDRLGELTPRQFELFACRLLEAYGFVDVKVTGTSADGGIDGYGKLHLGLASMNAAFQCKRWRGNIGRPEVDKFRGAIQGEFEQGVFFTTSDFTPQARNASLKRGAVPIILLNGEGIVDLMIEKELGVERVSLYVYYERPADFVEHEGE